MKKKKVLILTSRFPYEGGEYFLETESRYWQEKEGVTVYLMPFFGSKGIRRYPEWVNLRLENIKKNSNFSRVKFMIAAFFSRLFFREIFRQAQENKLSIENVFKALRILSRVLQLRSAVLALSREVGAIDVVYSYWNNVPAYAAALLKKEKVVSKVVTRAHGTDLYEYAQKGQYMPYKALLAAEFDLVASVSDAGRLYYAGKYPISLDAVQVHRLGVEVDGRYSPMSNSSSLFFVSISNCIDVKRVDVIARGALFFAKSHPSLHVRWVHIGDGNRLDQVKEIWAKESVDLKNIEAVFLGRLKNTEVIDYLANNPCDAIVNASSSEGVPVSIMEAMSLGIPAVAPKIGGIPELVSEAYGYLLPEMPSPDQVALGLKWVLDLGKSADVRRAAARRVADDYLASKNYSRFYKLIVNEV